MAILGSGHLLGFPKRYGKCFHSRYMAQSAMEYLMTYGWAILIIAVVLGALFGLGFFNSANLAPKVSAGACQVYRPQGPGTTSFINLEGTCNNELPQYVAQFNGASSYIGTGTGGMPVGSAARSVFAWVYTNATPQMERQIFDYGTATSANDIEFEDGYSYLALKTYSSQCFCNGPQIQMSAGAWHFVGFTYASGASAITVYLDSKSSVLTSGTGPLHTVQGYADIGSFVFPGGFWSGKVADVQVYNTSLTASEIAALYNEGIGGVPVLPQNLVGWWPLNGNANDYSGNLNNGAASNVIYTGSWTSGYSAP